jgi:hypothetical protein
MVRAHVRDLIAALSRRRANLPAAALVVVLALTLTACRTMLPRQYEYDEEIDLSLDGSATAYVNASVPALVALRGAPLDVKPNARVDRNAVRQFFSGPGVTVTRISTSRRSGRRFIHVRMDVNDVKRLHETPALSWESAALSRVGDRYVFKESVGGAAGANVGDVGWTGAEIIAFRLHLPARIRYHNAPSHREERGNILEWEQTLSDRLKGEPIRMEVRMDPASILYTTLALFGAMAVLVAVVFTLIIWLVVRKGRKQELGVQSRN